MLDEKIKFPDIRAFSENFVANLCQRMINVEKNSILNLSMIVDPRFAYSEEFLFNSQWENIENEFIDFIQNGKFRMD